jgi:membrane-associated PAP2 superfamily phosphatase
MTHIQTQPPDPRTFYLWHAGIPLIMACLLLVTFEYTPLDRIISNWFFDPSLPGFPLRNDWFLEVVLHQWGKYVLVALGIGLLICFLLGFKFSWWRRKRRIFLFLLLGLIAGPVLVALLKATTNRHCPYDLKIYGGFAPYVHLLESPPPEMPRGKCFPGGHASGGFAIMGFYLALYLHQRKLAYWALGIGFTYGSVLGFGRLMQGAHFLSHNLWTAVVCWFVSLALYRLILHSRDFGQGNSLQINP